MTSKSGANARISQEGFEAIRKTLSSLPTALRPILDSYDSPWERESLADKEAASFPERQAVETAFSQAFTAIIVPGDYIAAIDRVLYEPVMTLAPWTAQRMVLESVATALWLLEKDIPVEERVARSMALQYKSIQDQLRFLRDAPKHLGGSQTNILVLEQLLLNFGKTAKSRDIKLKCDRNGRVIRVGNGVPSIVELCQLTLNQGWKYRVLSGVAHGRNWALIALGFRRVEGKKALTQHLDPVFAALIMAEAIIWFSRAVWAYFDLAGRDLERLKDILENQYDHAHLKGEARFWRKLQTS